jgi:aminoacyl tRNA synthase complex-interacting multifunctional protein 1
VDPINPPAECAIGELIRFPGHASCPIEAGNKATKQYAKIADFLHADDTGVAKFKDVPFMTLHGHVRASFKGKIS